MSIDRGQLQALIRDLGAIPPTVRKTMRPAINRAGRRVLSQMKTNAAWSTRIPGAISMRSATGGTVGVRFRVNADRAPHARPYENDGAPGTFRHPVFGNREVWVAQAARPFFYRAVQDNADAVVEALGDAIEQAAREHGF
jgi:hypothetical protein